MKTEYFAESDRKAWVRYPPPRWIWQGAAICGIPSVVNGAMLHGWHGHNGVSLGNPRLGFVCTGQTVDGDPGLEGYYYDYGREIGEDERVRFARDEPTPDYDQASMPTLDVADWPDERRRRVKRSYAMEYVRSLLPTMLDLFGPEETLAHLGHAARLVGMQLHDETRALLAIDGCGTAGFARYLAGMAAAQGEEVEWDTEGDAAVVRQSGWRLMRDIDLPPAGFQAWNRLWEGALAVHDRRLELATERTGSGIVWHITRASGTKPRRRQ